MRLSAPTTACLLAASMLSIGLSTASAHAQISPGVHQTDTLTPIDTTSPMPYGVDVRAVSFADDLPTLHSYAYGEVDGKWVMLAGRTNGLHGFTRNGVNNFPPEFQNREVWVVDPVSGQSWSRSLQGQGFSEFQLNALTPTNNQFHQNNNTLYMTGGYGVVETPSGGTPVYGTFDTLSAIDLAGLSTWVQTGSGSATDHVRQIQNDNVKITGGAQYQIGDTTHLVMGQDFNGSYIPGLSGAYSQQVRSFEIVDDGTNLSLASYSETTPLPEYRRRDLNVFPILSPDGTGGTDPGIMVLSGVFTPNNGAWTVPVVIDENGNPTMADPNDPATFKQGFNGYHSAKVGLFDADTGAMHELLFGGISLQTLDADTDAVDTDQNLPFINDITSVVREADGSMSQHHMGYFPEVTDLAGETLRFGANAEFFKAPGIATLEGDIIDLQSLTDETMIGWIFGGLTANGPHTRGVPDVISAASNQLFEVWYTPTNISPVPEPASIALLAVTTGPLLLRRRRA